MIEIVVAYIGPGDLVGKVREDFIAFSKKNGWKIAHSRAGNYRPDKPCLHWKVKNPKKGFWGQRFTIWRMMQSITKKVSRHFILGKDCLACKGI